MFLLSSQSCSIAHLKNALLLGEARLLMCIFTPLGWLIEERRYWLIDKPDPHWSVLLRAITRVKSKEDNVL